MIKKKGYGINEYGQDVEYDDYEPESLIKESINIAKALKPLRFQILGFRLENGVNKDYVLHLRFVDGLSRFTSDDFGDTAYSQKIIVTDGPHDKPDSTE